MVCMAETEHTLSTRSVVRRSYRAVNVPAQIEIASHDGQRLTAARSGIVSGGPAPQGVEADQSRCADDRQGECYPKPRTGPASATSHTIHSLQRITQWPALVNPSASSSSSTAAVTRLVSPV